MRQSTHNSRTRSHRVWQPNQNCQYRSGLCISRTTILYSIFYSIYSILYSLSSLLFILFFSLYSLYFLFNLCSLYSPFSILFLGFPRYTHCTRGLFRRLAVSWILSSPTGVYPTSPTINLHWGWFVEFSTCWKSMKEFTYIHIPQFSIVSRFFLHSDYSN